MCSTLTLDSTSVRVLAVGIPFLRPFLRRGATVSQRLSGGELASLGHSMHAALFCVQPYNHANNDFPLV